MPELNATLHVRLKGDLERQARRHSLALERMGRSGERAYTRIGRSARSAAAAVAARGARTVGRFARSTTGQLGAALTLGAAGVAELREISEYASLQARSGLSAEKIQAIKQQVGRLAQAKRVRSGDLRGLLRALQDKGGLLQYAVANLDFLATAIQATEANPADLAQFLSAARQVLGLDPQTALSIVAAQGDLGNAPFAGVAARIPELLGSYKALSGRGGEEVLREMGALLQYATLQTGSVERASTSIRAFMSDLLSPENIRQLEGAGIPVYEDQATGRMRSAIAIWKDLLKIKPEAGLLDALNINRESSQGMIGSLAEARENNGEWRSIDRFLNVSPDTGLLERQAKIRRDTPEGVWIAGEERAFELRRNLGKTALDAFQAFLESLEAEAKRKREAKTLAGQIDAGDAGAVADGRKTDLQDNPEVFDALQRHDRRQVGAAWGRWQQASQDPDALLQRALARDAAAPKRLDAATQKLNQAAQALLRASEALREQGQNTGSIRE